jgi:hypothetical protein
VPNITLSIKKRYTELMYYLLFVLDILWSVIAWIVDYDKLFLIPVWAWPFCIVCPIYPALLAILWYKKAKKVKSNEWLVVFASLPSAVLGIMAIVYYPLKMINNGFGVIDLGQIFWVLFYSVQGWVLFHKKLANKPAIIFAVVFLVVKFTIDLIYLSFDYLDFSNFNNNQLMILYLLGVGLSLALGIYKLKKP